MATDSPSTRAPGLTTVLLAIEDTDAGAGAIATAVELATDTGAELIVLSVLPAAKGFELMGLDARAVEEGQIRTMVERVVEDACDQNVNARAELRRSGDAAAAIADTARELKADVIIVGRRGRSDLARAMLGDLTARVIGAASSPVLIVPRAARRSRRRIVLATDGSPASERAERVAALCAKLVGLPITVVSVEVPEHPAERQAEAKRIVDRTVAMFRDEGIDASGRVRRGIVADEIVAAATAVDADLIVLGSQGRSGLERMMLGSDCQAVIGRATCPVLVTTAQMIEYQSPKTRPPTLAETRQAGQSASTPATRTLLLVVDDSDAMDAAVAVACQRAGMSGLAIGLLRILSAPDARDDAVARAREDQARVKMQTMADEIERAVGEAPAVHVRWGDPPQQVLDLLSSHGGIEEVLLAAGAGAGNSASLIAELATTHVANLPVPVTIVPGSLRGRPA